MLQVLSTQKLTEIKNRELEIIRSGQDVEGHLLGGNLASFIHLLATPYESKTDNAILFFEDINEPAYKVDRMLTHLKTSGRLDRVAGIILGDFQESDSRTLSDIELIWDRILELTNDDMPIWANFPVGHGPRNMVLPLGTKVRMNSNKGILEFLEPSLSG